jgi:hypothetical protein
MPLFKRARGGATSQQIVTSDIDINTLDTDLTSISASHNTIPSAKAVVDFVGTSNSVAGMSDTTIGSIADNNHLQYDSISSKWVNRTFLDFSVISAPTAPGAEEGRLYLKEINSNNNALAIKIQKAGSVVEVELTSPGCVCGVCGSEDGAKDPIFNFQTGIMIVELYCGHSYEMEMSNLRRIQ